MAARKTKSKAPAKRRSASPRSSVKPKSSLQPVHLVMLGILAAVVAAVFIFASNTTKNPVDQDIGDPIDVSKSSLSEEDIMEITGEEGNNGEDLSGNSATVTLEEQNDSGQSGMVTISDNADGNAVVSINVYGGDAGIQPAQINSGGCGLGGAVRYDLTDAVDGRSKTTLSVSTQELLYQRPLSITVGESEINSETLVVCGNL